MLTEGWQSSLYCWACPPSSLSGRHGKILSPKLNTDPRRRRGVSAIRAKVASGSTSRENDEEYQQFKSMLGDAPSANPQPLDAKSAAYADFADMLGLDGSNTEQVDSRKSVAKLTSKRAEIDPADYSLFDAMLERTGGRGKKPTKGGKRYKPHVTNDTKGGAKSENLEKELESETRTSIDGHEESAKNAHAQHSLAAEEKAQAYAVMMEEFGPGVHDLVETWSPNEDVDENEQQQTQLLEPPERPGVPCPAEAAAEYDITTSEAAATYKNTTDEADSLTLQPKPSRPSHDDQSSLNENAEHALSQDDMEAADISLSSPSLPHPVEKGPLPQSLEDQSQRDENELTSKIHTTKAEVQPELNPPPTRSLGDDEVGSNYQALVAELQLRGSVFSASDENCEENSTVALRKLNRPDSVAGSTVSNHLQLDADTGRSHRTRTRFSRDQRLKRDGSVEILKDPKLVYKINE